MPILNGQMHRETAVTDFRRRQRSRLQNAGTPRLPRPTYFASDRPGLGWRFWVVIKDRAKSFLWLTPISFLCGLIGLKYSVVMKLILPLWLVMTIVVHAFNALSSRRAGNSRLSGTRVVASDGATPCPFWRAISRSAINSLPTISYFLLLALMTPLDSLRMPTQSFLNSLLGPLGVTRPDHFALLLLVFGFGFDLIRWMLAAFQKEGRSIADLIAGTRVIRTKAFLREHICCPNCHEFRLRSQQACGHCGNRQQVETPVINRRSGV